MTKVYGSNDPVVNELTNITQGIGGPLIPIESNTGGVGSVDSVNGMMGNVVLTTDDINEGATNFYIDAAQETLITNALQPSDNVSELTNDAGYITSAGAPVQTVFGRAGAVVAISTDYSAFYASTAQGALADTALQPGDNVSELVNDAGYITSAGAPVQSVNGETGVVVLDADDIDDTSTTNKFVNAGELVLIANAIQLGDNVSELVNDAGYVDNVSNEAVGGEKTLTAFTRVQYVTNAEGTLRLGANINAGSTLTTLTGKQFLITIPHYDATFPDVALIRAQSIGSANQLQFGFSSALNHTKITSYSWFLSETDNFSTSSGAQVMSLARDSGLALFLPIGVANYTVGTLPTVINNAIITVSDGDAGSPCLAVGIAGSWVRLTTGSAVSTTSRGLAPITIDTASVSSVTLNGTHYGRTLYVIGTGALDINLDATASAGKFANVINHSSGLVQFVASGTTVNAPTNGTLVIPQFGTASAFGVTASIWQISGQTVPA